MSYRPETISARYVAVVAVAALLTGAGDITFDEIPPSMTGKTALLYAYSPSGTPDSQWCFVKAAYGRDVKGLAICTKDQVIDTGITVDSDRWATPLHGADVTDKMPMTVSPEVKFEALVLDELYDNHTGQSVKLYILSQQQLDRIIANYGGGAR